MKTLLALTILLLSPAISPAAGAQDVDGEISTVEEVAQEPAGSREPSHSFEALPLILIVGQEVKVRDETGRATRGIVVSISDNQLVVIRRQVFWSREERAFTKEVVRSIDIVDSSWKPGGVVGAAAGVGLVAAAAEFGCSPSRCDRGDKIIIWVVGAPVIVSAGMVLGGLIDFLTNKTVYERQPQTPRITISPLLGRDRMGVMAGVHF